MFQKKDFGNVSVTHLLECDLVAPTIDINSASLDLLNYDAGMIIFTIGESNDSLSGSLYLELEVEESDDDSTFSDVADADLASTVTGTNTGTVAKIDDAAEDVVVKTGIYMGRKRYIRGVINVTGSHTNGTPLTIAGVRARAKTA